MQQHIPYVRVYLSYCNLEEAVFFSIFSWLVFSVSPCGSFFTRVCVGVSKGKKEIKGYRSRAKYPLLFPYRKHVQVQKSNYIRKTSLNQSEKHVQVIKKSNYTGKTSPYTSFKKIKLRKQNTPLHKWKTCARDKNSNYVGKNSLILIKNMCASYENQITQVKHPLIRVYCLQLMQYIKKSNYRDKSLPLTS